MTRMTKRRVRVCRTEKGGGLILALVFLVTFFTVGLPVFAFIANISAHMSVQADTRAIAHQTAQVMDDQTYWLELPRPGANVTKAAAVAESAAKAMCKKVGLEAVDVELNSVGDGRGATRTVCKLEVDATNRYPLRVDFPFLNMSGIFSGKLQVIGETEHSSLPPYALVHMDAPTRLDESNKTSPDFNQRDVAVLPSYGFLYKAVAGPSTVPATPYGKGIYQGLTPENFMAMNHYHLKKTDLEHVMITGQDIQLNGWHAERVYDGKAIVLN